jgi:hypothetical protein
MTFGLLFVNEPISRHFGKTVAAIRLELVREGELHDARLIQLRD